MNRIKDAKGGNLAMLVYHEQSEGSGSVGGMKLNERMAERGYK